MKLNNLLKSSLFFSLNFLAGSLLAGFLTLGLSESEARAKNQTRYGQSSAEENYTPSRKYGYSLGLSTITYVPNLPNSTSLTGTLDLTSIDLVQVFVSVPSTSPFNFGVMGLYKRTLIESQSGGIHAGGGLGLGTVDYGTGGNFAMSLSALVGLHFRLPGLPDVEAHLDGGAIYYNINTPNQSLNNLQISAFSPALGLSVLYHF